MSRIFIALLMVVSACSREKTTKDIIDESLSLSLRQYSMMADVMKAKTDLLPRSVDLDGMLVTARSNWWTSGFLPGSLWYLYEYSNDPKMKDDAELFTKRVEKEKNNTGTHDLGFMLYCSFGNGLRLTREESYNEVLMTGAKSLSTRFRPEIGCIQSWGSNSKWQYPVIIDNMMNLELLMWAFKNSNDSSFYKIAVTHADTTMKNHFRQDYSSYHVVSYDTITGRIEKKQTAQGFADESAWARGQVWGLYGYTMLYRETGLTRYLDQAVHIADFLINHPNMPEDLIPYWDFNAPEIPNEKRDASAAAIMASALIELSAYADKERSEKYLDIAEKQILILSTPEYRAGLGENGNFILKHSVGSIPGKSEVDVPLTYADYYYIEAMMRFRKLPEQK
jgi:hypothetical protein